MDAADFAVLPQGEVENRDVTEPNQEFWIAPRRIEIQAIRNAVRTFAASSGEDCPHAIISKGGIDVRQTLVVHAGEVADFTKGVLAEVHF